MARKLERLRIANKEKRKAREVYPDFRGKQQEAKKRKKGKKEKKEEN